MKPQSRMLWSALHISALGELTLAQGALLMDEAKQTTLVVLDVDL